MLNIIYISKDTLSVIKHINYTIINIYLFCNQYVFKLPSISFYSMRYIMYIEYAH